MNMDQKSSVVVSVVLMVVCAVSVIVTSGCGAPQLKTESVGLNYHYGQMANEETNANNVMQDHKTQVITVDLKNKISKNVGLDVYAGQQSVAYKTWDKTYTLRTVAVDNFGNILGTYGLNNVSARWEKLKGFVGGVSLRYYFGEEKEGGNKK